MSADPPASPLITPDLRRRLQQRYEEAARLMQQPADHARVHELLAECLRADPGNILYVDAVLANLRRWQPSSGDRSGRWFGWLPAKGRRSTEYSVLSTQYLADQPLNAALAHQLLHRAPELLQSGANQAEILFNLAAACAAADQNEAEVRYLLAARDAAPGDVRAIRLLARTLTRRGQFAAAAPVWRQLAGIAPDAEAEQAITDLGDASAHQAADRLLAETNAAAGEDLAIRRQREDLRLAHADRQLEVARRRAASDPHPNAQSLVAQAEAELLRQQVEVLYLRCERLPGDLTLRLELVRKLKQVGNFSGAIQRLEEARSDPSLEAEVLLELGECWQHLRQFDKALDFYRQAIEEQREGEAPAEPKPRTLALALYRIGVLTAAMGKANEAREAFTRLTAIEPSYKDARERLDKLPRN